MNVDCSDLVFNLRRPADKSAICEAVNGASADEYLGLVVVVVVVLAVVVVVLEVVVEGEVATVGLGFLA